MNNLKRLSMLNDVEKSRELKKWSNCGHIVCTLGMQKEVEKMMIRFMDWLEEETPNYNKGYEIKELSTLSAKWLIANYEEEEVKEKYKGLYFCTELDGIVTAIDNSTGNCWVEEFPNIQSAIGWLLNK